MTLNLQSFEEIGQELIETLNDAVADPAVPLNLKWSALNLIAFMNRQMDEAIQKIEEEL